MPIHFGGYDPATRTERRFHEDAATGELILEQRTDIEPILREAYEKRKEFVGGLNHYGGDGSDQHLVAHIPLSVLLDLRKRGIDRNQKKLKKWLNGEGAIYKTRPGTV